MLTQQTINHAITTSIETIRHRQQRVPISVEAIQRVYGVDQGTAMEIIGSIDVSLADYFPKLEAAEVTCSFSICSLQNAAYRVADILSGLPGMFRLKFYNCHGVVGYESVFAHPDQIGLINAVSRNGGYLFRLPLPGQETAFAAGEPVSTELWWCERSNANVDEYRDRGGFEAWKAENASRYWMPSPGPRHVVLHVQFPVRCSGERLHSLATQPEVTAILSLDGQDAFK